MTVAILYGGKSGEHEISLVSAAAIAKNINQKHDVLLIGIAKNGRWFLQDKKYSDGKTSDRETLEANSLDIDENPENEVCVIPGGGTNAFAVGAKKLSVDVVFPVLHGTFGEDGTVQGLLEMAGVAYVGCGVAASAVGMDKEKTKIVWQASGLPVVPYLCMTKRDVNDANVYDELINKAVDNLGFPLFVKPCRAGSSDGACKANNLKELSVALMDAFLWDTKVLIEKSINALEVECSVTGNSVTGSADCEALRVYGPGAIAPTHEFYDYDAKYNDPDGAALQVPAKISSEEAQKIRDLAIQAYKAVDADGFSRVDFFLDKDSGEIYLNEINTLPGFTQISMFPKLCEYGGLTFCEIIDLLLAEAEEVFRVKSNLRTER